MLEILLGFAVGAVIGVFITDRLHQRATTDLLLRLGVTEAQITRVMSGLRKDIDGEPELTNIEVTIEQQDNQLFAYRVDTKEFLGQGSDRDELIKRIGLTLQNVRLIIVEGSELIKETPTS
jgi:hypothetical protein